MYHLVTIFHAVRFVYYNSWSVVSYSNSITLCTGNHVPELVPFTHSKVLCKQKLCVKRMHAVTFCFTLVIQQ